MYLRKTIFTNIVYDINFIDILKGNIVNTENKKMQENHGFNVGDVIYFDTNDNMYKKSIADNSEKSQVYGVVTEVPGENVFAVLQGRTDLRRKLVESKIAYDKNDNIIAISLYNSFMTGKKCIGLTATTDTSLRELGKEAVKEIIRFDINNHKLFYWCECSGAIEHYFDKFHGFKIPNTYAVSLYNNAVRASKIVSLSEDGYHFVRSLTVQNDEYEIEKIIYSFPSQEIFDEMMKTNKYSIDEQLKAIDNSSKCTHLSDIEKADMVLDVFYGEVSDGYNNFSVYAMDILRKYTNLVHDAIKSNRHYSRYTRDDLQDIYDMGIQYLTLCSELKLYKC